MKPVNIIYLIVAYLCAGVFSLQASPVVQLSNRPAVEKLLEQAVQLYEAPQRVSHAGFTAKTPDNIDRITENLLAAFALEPYRIDLLISAANAQVYNGNVERAIELYEKILGKVPDDIDTHFYLAVWHYYLGNMNEADKYLGRFSKLSPAKYNDLKKIVRLVETVILEPLANQLPDNAESKGSPDTIIIMGYLLEDDGSMNPILLERLQRALVLSQQFPKASVITSGGSVKAQVSESQAMADWLVKHGVSRDRIIEEKYAESTIENALYCRYALASLHSGFAVIVSSAHHVRRCRVLFEIACWETQPLGLRFETMAAEALLPEKHKIADVKELLGIYRDALRVYGMWNYRSPPLEFR